MEGIPCEDFLTCAVAQFQNAKIPKNAKQQDGYFVVEDVGTTFHVPLPYGPLSVFGVMDGHGRYGEVCANFIRKALPHQLAMSEALAANQLTQASVEAVLRTEYLLRWAETLPLYCSGSCVTMVVVTPTTIVCANAGDCRAVLAYESPTMPGEWDYRNLSNDHNVANASDEEIRRIVNSGAQLTLDDRLTCAGAPGALQTTHALGDFWAKPEGRPEMVSSEPEVIEVARHGGQQMLIVCSDGVFSKLSSRRVVKLAHAVVAQEPHSPLSRIAHAIICAAADCGSDDNITCMVIALPRLHASAGKTMDYAEWTGEDRVAGSETQVEQGIHAPLHAKPGIRLGTRGGDPKNNQFQWKDAEYTGSYGDRTGANGGGAVPSSAGENMSSCRGKVRLRWTAQGRARRTGRADERRSQLGAEETNPSAGDTVPSAPFRPIARDSMEDASGQFPPRPNARHYEASTRGEPIEGQPHSAGQSKTRRRTSKKVVEPRPSGRYSGHVRGVERESSKEFDEMRAHRVYMDDAQRAELRTSRHDENVEDAQRAEWNTSGTFDEMRPRKESVDNGERGYQLGTYGILDGTMHIGGENEQTVDARKMRAMRAMRYGAVPNEEALQNSIDEQCVRHGDVQEGLVPRRNAMNEYETEKQWVRSENMCSKLESLASHDITPPIEPRHDRPSDWTNHESAHAMTPNNSRRARDTMRYTKPWMINENIPEWPSRSNDRVYDITQRRTRRSAVASPESPWKSNGHALDHPGPHQSAMGNEVDSHQSGDGCARTVIPHGEHEGTTEWRIRKKLDGIWEPVLCAPVNRVGNN
eukprot:GEMP01017286.1.p1 GENE.GEMP01017286.1~~GEMP01017286.1.p1  ORF type:complete len:810 (+),score=178.35 GEMP01017286.1:141-2570(+)